MNKKELRQSELDTYFAMGVRWGFIAGMVVGGFVWQVFTDFYGI